MGRWVIHLDLDAFYASAEQLTRPTLAGRPVLVGGLGPRGVVAGASYESRAFGIKSAMPMAQARRLLPANGVIVPPRFRVYERLSQEVFAVVTEVAPVLEKISLDESFAEPPSLIGASFDAVTEFCAALRARIRAETGLVASIGAGNGKQIAKIASDEAKPDGLLVVPQGTERAFLAPLPVRALWGIGPVAEGKLRFIGVQTLGQLAALSEQDAVATLGGVVGRDLRRLATGADDRPVAGRAETKQVSAETTFDTDIKDLPMLKAEVRRIAVGAHQRLLKAGRVARTVVIKLRHTDMHTVTRSETISAPTDDLAELAATAERLLIDPAEFGGIRLAGVAYSGLSVPHQDALFTLAAPSAPSTVVSTVPAPAAAPPSEWRQGDDVVHEEFGTGWVQGAGHGRVTVRFEHRSSGPGIARTFPQSDPALTRGDPRDCLR
ncbi:DNA polymerase IV [Amycolatopsis mediterranei S699]|uniref:DNA polymerase IV n=2 Tax=Amycolatopsis mediterranei TaxID=33910 RepID=A0A0H3CZG9_AMYMU|nr:DNA polymerase IV [Amycolatopsis mediterranei]ADJ43324.1 DNA polymerase IV [Amycolatopsis mediterranei U32]AEK40026.1 DNA polymerase IV [Amycolatopsis mediterranei S699]AFO75037.1 DNA polymerase IV [Amycolatopsis mediterranei S699]AGT82166.1 DNA polymerase IV [Amycolatopsis mediterranei RB]KDO11087.1 DNA polymerase IV [Amycolatopsis mediterranei]